MSQCEIQAIPLRAAVPAGRDVSLPVLVRIDPVRPDPSRPRPDLDLVLVLDRSGSMQGAPLENARRAAGAAVESLRKTDRVALVVYDQEVEVLAKLQSVGKRARLLEQIQSIEPGGATALFSGWEAGVRELGRRIPPGSTRLNRVLLLTDGQANIGVRHPRLIGERVARAARKGIQTTTLGFGEAYHEDLLRAMAIRGNGGHYFVERPGQMQDFFHLELARLEATVGTSVTLELSDPAAGLGVELLEEAPRAEGRGWRLTDLAAGCTTHLMFQLKVPAVGMQERLAVARFVLSWVEPGTGLPAACEVAMSLPVVSSEEWEALPGDGQVHDHLLLSLAGRAQSEAARHLSSGRPQRAVQALEEALRQLHPMPCHEMRAMQWDLEAQIHLIRSGSHSAAAKRIAASRHGGHGMDNHAYWQKLGKLRQLRAMVELATPLDEGELCQSYQCSDDNAPLPCDRAAGMLLGAAAWDLVGAPAGPPSPATRLTFRALAAMTGRCWFEPEEVAEALAGEPLLEGMEGFRARLKGQGLPWTEAGVDSEDDGALARVAGIVLPGAGPFGVLGLDTALYVALTHRNATAVSSAVAIAGLLNELLQATRVPAASWWWERYLELAAPWETSPVAGLLAEQVARAYERGLTVAEARARWGRGPHLKATVPTLLYLLARHAQDPGEAVARAVEDTANPALVAVVGAAVGALHGAEALPRAWRDAPVVAADHGEGKLLSLMSQALDVFCEGSSETRPVAREAPLPGVLPTPTGDEVVDEADRRPVDRPHSGAVEWIAFIDPRRAVSVARDASVGIWDFETGACLAALPGDGLAPYQDEGRRAWDLITGERLALSWETVSAQGQRRRTYQLWDDVWGLSLAFGTAGQAASPDGVPLDHPGLAALAPRATAVACGSSGEIALGLETGEVRLFKRVGALLIRRRSARKIPDGALLADATVRQMRGVDEILAEVGALWDEQRYPEALAKVERFQPTFPPVREFRTRCYEKLGDPERALEEWTAAVEANPRWSPGFEGRALLLAGLGRYELALRDAGRAVELAPAQAELYHTRAVVFQGLGQPERALADLEEALRRRPDFPEARARLEELRLQHRPQPREGHQDLPQMTCAQR